VASKSRIFFLIALSLIGLAVSSPAQQFYATGEAAGQIDLVDLPNKTVTPIYTAGGEPDSILINSQGQLIYDLSHDGILALYDPATKINTVLYTGLKSPRDLVFDVPTACNPNANANTMLLSEYSIGQIIRYDFTTGSVTKLGAQLGSPTTGFSVDGLAYDLQGNLFAVANHNTVVQLDPCTGSILKTLVLEPHYKVNGGDGMVFDPYSGQLWISHDGTDNANGLIEVPTDLSSFALFQTGQIAVPDGIVSDGKGNLYIGAGLQRLMVYNIPTDTLAQPQANALVVPGIDSLALIPANSTSTAITASPNPSAAGQPVTLTATITPAPTGQPLGNIVFYNGSIFLNTATINASGVATFTTSSLPAGTDSLTAVYSGNLDFAGSKSTPVVETITGLTATSTLLTASPNPSLTGQAVTLTATVTPTPTGAPLGTVKFYLGTTLLDTQPINSSGIATSATSALPVGSDSVTAVYSGNAAFATSTSAPVTEVVTSVVTATALSASPNPSGVGQSVTLTATISPIPTGAQLGTVTFFEGTTVLNIANVNSSGIATFITTTLALGSNTLTATYSGNGAFAASTSSPLTVTVGNSATFTVAGPQNTITMTGGNSENLTITVAAAGGDYEGTVTMSASGLPSDATVTFKPATVTPKGSSAKTTMTIQTTAQDAAVPAKQKSGILFASLFLVAGFCLVSGKNRSLGKSLPVLLAFTLLAGGTLSMIGCGGGSSSSGSTGQPQGQSKTYTVTVSGTDGTASASSTFTLVVK